MLSDMNLVTSVFDNGSKNNPKVLYGLFWKLQDALALGDATGVMSIMSQASEENGRLPKSYNAFLNGPSDGKHAAFLSFVLPETSTERKAYNAGRTRETRVDKAFGKYDYRAKTRYMDRLIYTHGQYGVVSESPNSLEFWVKVWFAHHMQWLGELRGQDWLDWTHAAKLDKKTDIAKIGETWRESSPQAMHAQWMTKQANKSKARKAKRTKKSEPIATETGVKISPELATASANGN